MRTEQRVFENTLEFINAVLGKENETYDVNLLKRDVEIHILVVTKDIDSTLEYVKNNIDKEFLRQEFKRVSDDKNKSIVFNRVDGGKTHILIKDSDQDVKEFMGRKNDLVFFDDSFSLGVVPNSNGIKLIETLKLSLILSIFREEGKDYIKINTIKTTDLESASNNQIAFVGFSF